MTSDHLTDQQIARYVAGELAPSELLLLHDHLAECAACRDACSAHRWGTSDGGVPTLRRFLREPFGSSDEESDHLSYEQLIAHVEGTLGDIDREIADSHLDLCSMCARERSALAAYILTRPAEAVSPRPVLRFWRVGAVLAAAAALVLLAWIVPGMFRRSAPSRIAVKPAPGRPDRIPPALPALAVPDAAQAREAKELREKDALIERLLRQNASLRLHQPPRSAPIQVASALISPDASAQIRALQAGSETLMGSDDHGGAMKALSPVGVIVVSVHPVFRWTVAQDENGTSAGYYVVQVWDPRRGQAHPLVTGPQVRGISWTPSQALPRGIVLRWQVKAYLEGGEFLAAAPRLNEAALFRITELTRARQITQQRIALARVYLQGGMVSDAEQVLTDALQADPGNPAALTLLKQAKSAKR